MECLTLLIWTSPQLVDSPQFECYFLGRFIMSFADFYLFGTQTTVLDPSDVSSLERTLDQHRVSDNSLFWGVLAATTDVDNEVLSSSEILSMAC